MKNTTQEGVFGDLISPLQKAIRDAGYDTPTPIQSQAIPPIAKGRDLVGSAQTGTGKTAAFTLPLLQRLSGKKNRLRKNAPRALVLAPTRELAAQIGESIETYSKYLHLRHTVIFGGVKQGRQVAALNRGVDILVATPGRLLDLMNQKFVYLDGVEFFILDEVDRMLDMGFIHDIKKVLKVLPENRQTLFFSATMPRPMLQLASSMVTDPVRIEIAPDQPTVERISQELLFVAKSDKDNLLADTLKGHPSGKTIVFTQMKHAANKVARKLEKAKISAAAIHGNKSQGARTRALDGFKSGNIDVLVATDVAARGIDVDGVSHVINYDLPVEAETYVHRIGRTARAGKDGRAISFCDEKDRALLHDIEKLLGGKVPVTMDHDYHSERVMNSKGTPAGKKSGGGGGGNRNRNQRRSQKQNSRSAPRNGANGNRNRRRRRRPTAKSS